MKAPGFLTLGLGLGVVACGGTVVFEEGEGAGGGSVTTGVGPTSTGITTGGSPTSTGNTTGSGPSGCTRHEDCGDDLCIFATGTCATPCLVDGCSSCGVGLFCDDCASSACPECNDCRAACVPIEPGQCDDDDPCLEGRICRFFEGRCDAPCTADGACEDLDEVCAPCETSSCCGCKDCVGGCIPPED